MNTKFLYGPISSAINRLRNLGFSKDFSLKNNQITWDKMKFDVDDLKIVALVRYEGDSDPGDRASVYAIEAKNAIKGLLVTNDDGYSEGSSRSLLKKLHLRLLKPGG